jgi:hypothetical protein
LVMAYLLAEDDNNTFRRTRVIVISPLVQEKISTKFMINNWSAMLEDRMNGPMIFEAYMRALMVKDASVFECRSFGRCVPCDTVTLGGCTEIRLVSHYVTAARPDDVTAAKPDKVVVSLSQLVAAVKAAPAKVIFHSTNKLYPLIDFLYKDETDHFHAFQASVGKSHDANVESINKLEALVGDASKLSIYYVVPDFRFKEFKTKPEDPTNPLCTIFHVKIPDPNASYRTSTETAPLGTLSVWFHLHIRTESNATPVGEPTLVNLSETSSISDLKKTVKLECSANLRGVRGLQVFPPNTISFLGKNALRPGAFVPSSTTDAMPLIVTYLAPRA